MTTSTDLPTPTPVRRLALVLTARQLVTIGEKLDVVRDDLREGYPTRDLDIEIVYAERPDPGNVRVEVRFSGVDGAWAAFVARTACDRVGLDFRRVR
jgi:hypothetical protein